MAGLTPWLVWSNLLMAGSAAGWVVCTALLLGLPVDPVVVGQAFLLTAVFYLRDRMAPAEQHADRFTMPARTAWLAARAVVLRRLGRVLAALAVATVVLRPACLPWLLGGLGLSVSYTVKWIPRRGGRVAWKQLPAAKEVLVALLWTVVTVLVPVTVTHGPWSRPTALTAAAVWCLVATQILVNDLRDVDEDRRHGTRSLPVLIGPPAARLVGCLLCTAAILATPGLTPLALATAATALGYRREHDARWRPWIEAQGLLAAALLVLR
ncbi:UbiA family prenyltransferase [Kitasatospora viridis]|uniref:UbiA prenyltransferase family protein n=1 Tax=Kitasatospora viridis TaxID=281105 RepID=A0A561SDM3_9ACTN|nr:UbiA family prenyltransferase [Kitasatospora viridis]TWF72954.1 UbiA prenyltransferase family protein [Kitasatospora viridis]